MTCVVLSDGSISKRQKDILNEQARFYKSLHKAGLNIEFSFTNSTQPKLDEDGKFRFLWKN